MLFLFFLTTLDLTDYTIVFIRTKAKNVTDLFFPKKIESRELPSCFQDRATRRSRREALVKIQRHLEVPPQLREVSSQGKTSDRRRRDECATRSCWSDDASSSSRPPSVSLTRITSSFSLVLFCSVQRQPLGHRHLLPPSERRARGLAARSHLAFNNRLVEACSRRRRVPGLAARSHLAFSNRQVAACFHPRRLARHSGRLHRALAKRKRAEFSEAVARRHLPVACRLPSGLPFLRPSPPPLHLRPLEGRRPLAHSPHPHHRSLVRKRTLCVKQDRGKTLCWFCTSPS
jgi:hypothetical protein